MEVFASLEFAGKMLRLRVLTGVSRTFYVREEAVRRVMVEPPQCAWPVWDETGHYRVWLRKAADPVPALLSRPDEEWLIRESGTVERLPWADGEEVLVLSDTGERALTRPIPS